MISVAEASNHLCKEITKSENDEFLVTTLTDKFAIVFKDEMADS